MIILGILMGLLVGLVIGAKAEAFKWRQAAKMPNIRVLSSNKFYNVCTSDYYDQLNWYDN